MSAPVPPAEPLYADDWEASLPSEFTDAPPAWEEPIPLGQARTLPTFPTDALPTWLGAMVDAVAEETQTPADLAGGMALAALSTACGGRAVVSVRGRWREPVNLYTVTALPPGNRKSAVVGLLIAPVLAVEKTLVERANAQIAEAEVTAKLARSAAEKAAQKAANADASDQDRLTAEAISLAQSAEQATVPVRPQLIAQDITAENATTLLAEQGGRLALMSAEGGGIFDIIAGRYSGKPNMEVFLQGHAGDMLRVNRQGRDAQFIEAPALTMGLAVQPSVLADIAKVQGFDGRGLLARFLYAVPESLVGYRNLEPDTVPDEVADAYAEKIRTLTLAMADWTDPAVLTLSSEAAEVMLAHRTQVEHQLRKSGPLRPIAEWASKLDGAVARIAGLLHLADHPADGYAIPISADTLTAAARIGAYYTAHALTVFDAMGADPALTKARTVLAWLQANPADSHTKREIFRGLPSGAFPAVADLDPALALLEDHGWIRQEPQPPRTSRGGRPPSPRYQTHPQLTQPTT
ncbi:YfjI family protein [Kitasatospora sp. NPDC087314]|uniref:YfjI family protein n=1 Tax=Kitasatospora sp. NPDC087314 TaxID=3364068 RepID=UPI00382855BF